MRCLGNQLPIWLHYSGFQASRHIIIRLILFLFSLHIYLLLLNFFPFSFLCSCTLCHFLTAFIPFLLFLCSHSPLLLRFFFPIICSSLTLNFASRVWNGWYLSRSGLYDEREVEESCVLVSLPTVQTTHWSGVGECVTFKRMNTYYILSGFTCSHRPIVLLVAVGVSCLFSSCMMDVVW
jgi:hypothetical protein